MPVQERDLTIFVDIDGTQNTGRKVDPVSLPLFSLGTTSSLLLGRFSLPPTATVLREAKIKGNWREAFNTWFHTNRELTEDSEDGLIQLALMRETYIDRKITIEVLSGRQPYLHPLTTEQLWERKLKGYFDGVRLNASVSSSAFKEAETIAEVARGQNVVLIEDDVKAALKVSRTQSLCAPDQSVRVLLLRNASNSDWLLNRARVSLPDNIIKVDTFTQAVMEIRQGVYSGQL